MEDLRVYEMPTTSWQPRVGHVVGAISLIVIVAAAITLIVVLTTTTSSSSINHQIVITKQIPRLPGYGNWCYITFNQSHVGWNKNQSPSQWSRFFIYSGPNNVQITPYDEEGNISARGLDSKIIEGYGAYNVVYVSLEYWGEAPWKLYIGQDKKNMDHSVAEKCPLFILF
jgi:hypothetical protein